VYVRQYSTVLYMLGVSIRRRGGARLVFHRETSHKLTPPGERPLTYLSVCVYCDAFHNTKTKNTFVHACTD